MACKVCSLFSNSNNEVEKREIKEQLRKSKHIDRELKLDKKKQNKVFRLLLLGAGESGKSTVVKQMKILHVSDYSETERKQKVVDIKKNVWDAILAITDFILDKMNTNTDDIKNQLTLIKNESEKLESINSDLNAKLTNDHFSQDFFQASIEIWKTQVAQEAYTRSNEYQLIDCAKYFLDKIQEISQPQYSPSNQDILRCRIWTYGIFETKFTVKQKSGTDVNFHLFDIGGQRDQRRKWIQCFNDVTAIIFVVACSSYNMLLREDQNQNRLTEALDLFFQIWNNRWLKEISCILFLNKQDLLKEKIELDQEKTNLETYFPDFAGYLRMNAPDYFDGPDYYLDENDPEGEHPIYNLTLKEGIDLRSYREEKVLKAKEYIKAEFVNISESDSPQLKHQCYYHFTCAIDTQNIDRVFNAVTDIIQRIHLGGYGLL